jgi:hypothetical protein
MFRNKPIAPLQPPVKKTFEQITADLTAEIQAKQAADINTIRIAPHAFPYLDVQNAAKQTVRQWLAKNHPEVKVIAEESRYSLWTYNGVNHAT